ncbi:MAG: hypothetical protein QOF71_1120 [Candidatus Eremiobacteraeota bacterium]|nr:hypothetical protein [Candidatus Eremiobacteraeota bacterium]
MIDVPHLARLRARAIARRAGVVNAAEDAAEWANDNTVLRGLGLGWPETIAYLFEAAPSLDEFERWIVERNGGTIDARTVARINAALDGFPADVDAASGDEPGLTPDELAFFDEHGYVVLHDAVTAAQCRAAEDAVWEFLSMDRDEPSTWYANPHGHSIWVPLVRHPALWANRRSPRIARAFSQLWRRNDLWVSVDRAGFNPPETRHWQFPGPNLHWDANLTTPMPFDLSGILYLSDTAADQGAFTCVPGFHRRLAGWLAELPPGADPAKQNLDALGAIPIAGRTGDLIIWHHALPHGSSPNRARRPRIVQYIEMKPSSFQFSPRLK